MRLAALCLLISGCSIASADVAAPEPAGDHSPRRQIVSPRVGSWRADHSGMACALPRGEGFRLFVTGKPPGSDDWQIGWLDVDRDFTILDESPDAVLKKSLAGHDVRGCLMPYVVDCGDSLRMYYVGVGRERYPLDLNHRPMLAVSYDHGETWNRRAKPLLDLEPFEDSIGTHCVWREGLRWRMIYTSVIGRPPHRRYHLRFAESSDGIAWHKPEDNVALDIPDRTCGRPVVWRDGDRYLMTFCFSGGGIKYRVRIAESSDGSHFRDLGQILDVAPKGFDSDMVTYAFPIPERGILIYSGNQWGAAGLGVAPLEIPH